MYAESVSIYVLIDPRNNEIRYVGKTSTPLQQRLNRHRHDARHGPRSHKANWLSQLLRCGYEPRMEIVQVVSVSSWEDAEKYWIGYYREIGCRLTNMTDGGDSGPTMCGETNPFYGRSHTGETRERLRAARQGSTHSDATRAKLSAMRKANPNKGTFQVGHVWSDASKAKRSASQRGVLHTDEEKAKIRNALRGRYPAKAACQRWQINRGKPCVCGHHID